MAGSSRQVPRSILVLAGTAVVALALATAGRPLAAVPSLASDGQLIAVPGHLDGGVKLIDARTGRPKYEHKTPMSWVYAVAFSPDGKKLAIGGGDLYHGDAAVLDPVSGKVLWAQRDIGFHHGVSLGWSPDGNTLVAGCPVGDVKLFDAQNGKLQRTLEAKSVGAIAYSANGKVLAAVCRETADRQERKPQVRLWDPQSGKLLRSVPGAFGRIALSPDGTMLAAAAADDAVIAVTLYDVQTGAVKHALKGDNPHGRMAALTLAPQGNFLAGHDQRVLYLWNAGTGKLLRKQGEQETAELLFSTDGQSLIGLRGNGRKLWDVRALIEPAR